MITAVSEITQTISNIDGITASIAGAVEEQNAVTAQISQSVEMVSSGTGQVTTAVAGVPKAARDTGEVAERLDTLAQNLASDADNLQHSVNTLLARLAA
jgi:methyl-accepting chemotaxis protein